jgi:hypothetical protein
MSGPHFYLTLPSNASLDVFPDNKTTEYHVQLPQSIDLEGDWETGVYSISYPYTWYTMQDNSTETHFLFKVPTSKWYDSAVLEYGHYETMNEFTKGMTDALETEIGNRTDICLTYNAITGKVAIRLKPGCKLYLNNKLSLILGFGGKELMLDAAKGAVQESPLADLSFFSSIFTYCNIVQAQVVGDVNARLIKTVPVEGTYGDTITRTFTNIQYLPVETKSFEDVEIVLRTDTGDPVPFERGKVVVTLHFRKHTYFT